MRGVAVARGSGALGPRPQTGAVGVEGVRGPAETVVAAVDPGHPRGGGMAGTRGGEACGHAVFAGDVVVQLRLVVREEGGGAVAGVVIATCIRVRVRVR